MQRRRKDLAGPVKDVLSLVAYLVTTEYIIGLTVKKSDTEAK